MFEMEFACMRNLIRRCQDAKLATQEACAAVLAFLGAIHDERHHWAASAQPARQGTLGIYTSNPVEGEFGVLLKLMKLNEASLPEEVFKAIMEVHRRREETHLHQSRRGDFRVSNIELDRSAPA